MGRKRAMTSEQAKEVRQRGHEDAKEFAIRLGIGREFRSDPQAKKDVIDTQGLSYSVKSGVKKWQIFLYGKKRFENNTEFQATNFGQIFLDCINSFPELFSDYQKKKEESKLKLQSSIRKLSEKLQDKKVLRFFLSKSLFNSNEVDFLVVKQGEYFHVFERDEVLDAFSENLTVTTSKARMRGQYDDQKVVFKFEGKTIGEIEMRNDSEVHYREVKFWLHKVLSLELLMKKIPLLAEYETRNIRLYSKSRGETQDVTGSKRRIDAFRKQLEGGGKADG